jgi:hypothetical protein
MAVIGIIVGLVGAAVGIVVGLVGGLVGIGIGLVGGVFGLLPLLIPLALIAAGIIWLVKGSDARNLAGARSAHGEPRPQHSPSNLR